MTSSGTVIIAGADRRGGISGMLAETAANRGWNVVCVGLSESGSDLLEAIQGAGGAAAFFRGDASDRAFMEEVAARTIDRFGAIDGLVVGAAVAPANDGIESMTVDSAAATFRQNFGPALSSTQAVVPHFVPRERGAIVLVGTANVYSAQYGQPEYACTKAPLAAFVAQLTVAYARYGIRANLVTPSTVPNDGLSWQRRKARYGGERLLRAMAERRPSKRLSTPAGVAAVILMLLGDDASELFGNEVKVDGGESAAGGELSGGDWHAEIVERALRFNRVVA